MGNKISKRKKKDNDAGRAHQLQAADRRQVEKHRNEEEIDKIVSEFEVLPTPAAKVPVAEIKPPTIQYAPSEFLNCIHIFWEALDTKTLLSITLVCKQACTILAPIISSNFYFTNKAYKYTIYSPKKFILAIIGTNEINEFKQVLVSWLPEGTSRLKLIYEAKRHGPMAYDFHRYCDGAQNTLVIIKSTRGYLFGGFTTQPWQGSMPHGAYPASSIFHQKDPHAFIFTLTNPHGIPPTKFPVDPDKSDKAILNDYRISCAFGDDLCLGTDVFQKNSKRIAFPDTYVDTSGLGYEIFTGNPTFIATNVFVFMVQPVVHPIYPNAKYSKPM